MKLFLLLILFFQLFIYAETSMEKNNSLPILFSIDTTEYTSKEFPKEFETLPNEIKLLFISKYLFYKILLDSIKEEKILYFEEIQKNIKLKKEENQRIGKILTPIEKLFFEKKITANTIAYYEVLKKDTNITQKVKNFYHLHKKEFFYPKRVELSLITVKDKKTAKKILKELKEKKNDIHFFSKVAKKYSLLKSNLNGGYIGYVVEKGLGKKKFNILYKNEVNQIVPKILDHKGYYSIAYLLSKSKSQQKTLSELSEKIKMKLLKKKIDEWKQEKFQTRKKEVKVKLNKI